jgi:signal transduction histidine kinase
VFFLDPEGSIWIGTAQTGVALVAPRSNRFSLHGLPVNGAPTAPSDVVRVAVQPIAKGWLVLTLQQGLYTMDSTGTVTGHIPSPWPVGSPEMFHDMLVAPDGKAWVGTSDGLFLADPRTMRFIPVNTLRLDARSGQGVQALWADGVHGLWCDVDGRGLWHLDTWSGAVRTIEDRAPGISKHLRYPLRDVSIDAQGRIWIAMTSKPPVVIWPDGHFTVWKSREEDTGGLPSVFLTTLCEGLDGTMWAGTWSDGLIGMRLDADGRREHVWRTTSQGLPSNAIYGLVRAHDGAIWGAGKSGLFRFDPIKDSVQRYGLNDGLPTPEIYLTLDISPDGKRVFGGLLHGLLTFQVDSLRPQYHVPRVQVPMVQVPMVTVFDSAVVFNADLAAADLTLPHDRSDLRFVLRSTNMVDPFNDTYAYRLAPDTNWTLAPAQDAIIFSQIPPGTHAFEVKARTGTGAWGPVSRVPFTIRPPWWNTWWFRSALFVVVCMLAYLGFRMYLFMRLRKQRTAHEREQALMHERIRIASDMHDDLGSGLSVIKVKSQIALLTETDPVRVRELEAIASGSGELIDNMRQIVWTLGSGQEKLADLLAYMRNYAAKFLDQHTIQCVFRADELPDPALGAIERRNLLLILKEALHNVVKHAQATRVDIALSWDRGLRLSVSDNGRGMDPHGPTTFGMGMSSMRQRIEQLGGTMHLTDQGGTTLTFHLPDPGSAERSIAGP